MWVCGMEVRNDFGGVSQFRSWQPRCFFVGAFVAGPSYEVQEFASAPLVNLGVKDSFDFVFSFSFDVDRRWQRLRTAGDGVGRSWLEHGNMEYQMYGA